MSFRAISQSFLLYFVSAVVATVWAFPSVVVTVMELSVMLATVPMTCSIPLCAYALLTMSTSVKKVAIGFFMCLLRVLVMVHCGCRRSRFRIALQKVFFFLLLQNFVG